MIKFNIKNFRHVMIVWTFSHLVCRSGSWRSLCCISESVTAQIHIQYIIIITIIDVYQVEAGVSGVLHVAKPIQTLGYFSTRLISAGKYCHHAFLLQRDQSVMEVSSGLTTELSTDIQENLCKPHVLCPFFLSFRELTIYNNSIFISLFSIYRTFSLALVVL